MFVSLKSLAYGGYTRDINVLWREDRGMEEKWEMEGGNGERKREGEKGKG